MQSRYSSECGKLSLPVPFRGLGAAAQKQLDSDYAAVVVEKLSDRVRHWITLNEPQCFIQNGHVTGIHAPGDRLGTRELMVAAHNVLLAHGRAVQAIRSGARAPCKIGFAPVAICSVPATESDQDIAAARGHMFSCGDVIWNNTWWMDPIIFGWYPIDGLRQLGADAPAVHSGDMDIISQPLDFIGANDRPAVGFDLSPETAGRHGARQFRGSDHPVTSVI